jgi:hypothetical protein
MRNSDEAFHMLVMAGVAVRRTAFFQNAYVAAIRFPC